MTDQQSEFATPGTALIEPQTVGSTLVTIQALPIRLSDEELRLVTSIAKADLPSPLPTDDKHFAACMKALSILPRRKDDEATGELRFRIYRSTLGHLPRIQLDWMVQEAVKRFEWFPSVKQLLDLADRWTRRDEAVEAKRLARSKMIQEHSARDIDARRKKSQPLTQADVDVMSPELQSIGLKCGALLKVDGKVVPAP